MKNNAQLLMPREKMLKFGISALTDVELLALFLRTGTRGKDVLTTAKRCWRISALFMACW